MNRLDNRILYVLIPEDTLDELLQAIRDLREFRPAPKKDNNPCILGDYIDEDQAMKILKRGKTWFWTKRKTGELPAKKAAGRWYYKAMDINKYIDNGRSI